MNWHKLVTCEFSLQEPTRRIERNFTDSDHYEFVYDIIQSFCRGHFSINALSWLEQTKTVLFAPREFFEQLREQSSYRRSVVYLAKTAFIASLINALVLTLMFYLLASAFASILSAFVVVFGILLTPLIAVAANLPPDKVPGAVAAFAKDGGIQVLILSAKLGAFFFVGNFCTIIASTCLVAGIAHAITRLLGSTIGFRATATAYSFASAAWMLSSIPVVNLITPIYGVVLDIIAMRQLHSLSRAKAIAAVAIAAVIPGIGLIAFCCR